VGGFGLGKQALLEAWRHGGRPNGTVPIAGTSGPRQLPAYQVDIVPVGRFVSGTVSRRMNRFAKLAVLGAALALEDAGWEIPPRRNDIGLVLASGYGASKSTFDFLDSMIEGEGQYPSPTLFSNSVHSSAASHVSIVMELGGPCLTVSQFEMSPISALLTARDWLVEGRVEAVLFGAVDEICPVLGYCYDQFFGVSTSGPIEPFAWDKQTAVMGEGAAFLLLKRPQEGHPATAISGSHLDTKPQLPPVDHLLVLGADGHTCYARDYRRLSELAARCTVYTPLYGSLPGGQAFDVAIAALAMELESEQRPICSVKCDAQGNCGVIECCFGHRTMAVCWVCWEGPNAESACARAQESLPERWLDVLCGRAPHETALGLYFGSAYDWSDLHFSLASWQALYDYETIWGHRARRDWVRLEADLGVATGTEFSGERLVASGNFLAVYEFGAPQRSKFVPYVEAGVGLIYTDFQREGQAYRVNFNPVAGVGIRSRTTFLVLRLHHLSNGGLNDDNRGINSVVLGFGVYLGSER
jgi:3-oxoacyl-[acyl-carrier-protein] synthase II